MPRMLFFGKVLNQQLVLLLLVLVGFIVKKCRILNRESEKAVSSLLVNVLLPCNIVHSFLGEITISAEFVKSCVLAIVIAAAVQAFAVFAGKILFRAYPLEKQAILRYGIICSNSSFVGMPIAETLYGSLGVLYTSLFQIPIRFTMWTAGLSLFTSVNRKDAFRKLVTHPCIVSIFIGIVLMLARVELPQFLGDTIYSISRTTVPISMITVGSIMADADVKSLFAKSILYYTFLRLIAFPLLVYGVLKLLAADALLINIAVIMTAMPAGASTSILAEKYDGDAQYAAQLTFVSTLCSIVTIPLISLLFA